MKTRSKQRTRLVPHVINGKAHQVKEQYEVEMPVPPKDWDSIVLNAVMAATCLVVVGAVAWSTVSIGDLLSRAAPTWVSYLVAGVFDLAWIICMATEWLSRYDSRKAKMPKVGGWVALAVSMGAIFTHGSLVAASFWVGVFGAIVSALAKGMWLVVMRHTAKELDGKARQWVEAETAEVNAQLAMAAVTRQLNRTRARAADELAALGQPSTLVVERAAPSAEHEHPEQARPVLARPEQQASTPPLTGHEHRAATPSMAELAREQLASGTSRPDVVASILQAMPDAKKESVQAEVRRQARKLESGPYL